MLHKKITYIFGVGRKNILNNPNYSDEFFYGYKYFAEHYHDVNFIEFIPELNKKYLLIDKVLRKISNLPFYFNNIMTKNNYERLFLSDLVVFTNERMLISSLIYLTIIKRKKELKSVVIIMGLFSKNTKNKIKNILQKLFINFTLSKVDHVIFLGIGEFESAVKKFPKHKSKFKHIPFMLNNKFWIVHKNNVLANKDKILFIGNDGKRDYEKLIGIAKELPEFRFIFVSKIIKRSELKSNNIELISGYWNENILSDKDIQHLYDQSRITILPLKESTQPSGQSVTLQSMSRGVPVLISKTDGFWDKQSFENKKNIIFLDDNSIENWVKTIKETYYDYDLLDLLSKNSIAYMKKSSNSKDFYLELKKIIS